MLERGDLDDAARVDLAYRLTLGRSPTPAEVERTTGYLADFESAAREVSEESPEPKAVEVSVAKADAEERRTMAREPLPSRRRRRLTPIR